MLLSHVLEAPFQILPQLHPLLLEGAAIGLEHTNVFFRDATVPILVFVVFT